MSKRQKIRAAKAEVEAGTDRRQVFDKYKSQFSKPVQLASAIAGVAKEEDKVKMKSLNLLLVIVLVAAGFLNAIGAFFLFVADGLAFAIALSLVACVVPFAFAYEVNRFNGQTYGVLGLFCGFSAMRALIDASMPEGAFGAIFLLLIVILALAIKKRLFPSIGLLGATRKDEQGEFLLG